MVREQLLNAVGQLQLLRIRQGQQLAGLLLQQLAADHKVLGAAAILAATPVGKLGQILAHLFSKGGSHGCPLLLSQCGRCRGWW